MVSWQDFSVDGLNSIVVQAWTPDALATALHSLVVNATLRQQMGEDARVFAGRHLSSLALSPAAPALYSGGRRGREPREH